MPVSTLSNYAVEPSYGTHFMHNITALNVGYFSVGGRDDLVDWSWLAKQPQVAETEFIRHVRTPKPAPVKIDGRKSIGAVLKPGD